MQQKALWPDITGIPLCLSWNLLNNSQSLIKPSFVRIRTWLTLRTSTGKSPASLWPNSPWVWHFADSNCVKNILIVGNLFLKLSFHHLKLKKITSAKIHPSQCMTGEVVTSTEPWPRWWRRTSTLGSFCKDFTIVDTGLLPNPRPGSFSDGTVASRGIGGTTSRPHWIDFTHTSLNSIGAQIQTWWSWVWCRHRKIWRLVKARMKIQELGTTQVALRSQTLRGTDANSWQNATPRRRATSGSSNEKWRDKSAKLN